VCQAMLDFMSCGASREAKMESSRSEGRDYFQSDAKVFSSKKG